MNGKEIVITGLGVVSPIANELNLFWEGIKSGKSGISRVESMEDIDQFPVQIAGEIRNLDIEKYMDSKEARKVDPFTAYGVAAASMAVEDAGLDKFSFDQERAGVLVSSGTVSYTHLTLPTT